MLEVDGKQLPGSVKSKLSKKVDSERCRMSVIVATCIVFSAVVYVTKIYGYSNYDQVSHFTEQHILITILKEISVCNYCLCSINYCNLHNTLPVVLDKLRNTLPECSDDRPGVI